MASAHWRTGHTLTSLLQQPEAGWNFLQLVRLLINLPEHRQLVDVGLTAEGGTGADASFDKGFDGGTGASDSDRDSALLELLAQRVKFKASLAADFPPGEIRQVDYQAGEQSSEVTTVSGVLAAADSPMPEPFLAWVRDLSEQGDHAMADFFDLFNNRLLALRYLIGRTTRPTLMDRPVLDSDSGRLMLALVGKTMETSTRQRDLGLAGLFANCRMSLPMVRQLLSFSMGLTLMEMRGLQGGWLKVDQQDHSQLGDERVSVLGQSATLGKRVWDQQKAIELVIGPLNWQELRELVPGGERHTELLALLRRISDGRCDCRVTFICPREQLPQPRLGFGLGREPGTLALGLTAALGVTASVAGIKQPQPLRVSFTVPTASMSLH